MAGKRAEEFSDEIKREHLVRSKRICCWCEQYHNIEVQVNHIIPIDQGGTGDSDNAVVLCLNCHSIICGYDSKHPVGTKIKPQEVKERRDLLYANLDKNTIGLIAYSPADCDHDRLFLQSIIAIFEDTELDCTLLDICKRETLRGPVDGSGLFGSLERIQSVHREKDVFRHSNLLKRWDKIWNLLQEFVEHSTNKFFTLPSDPTMTELLLREGSSNEQYHAWVDLALKLDNLLTEVAKEYESLRAEAERLFDNMPR